MRIYCLRVPPQILREEEVPLKWGFWKMLPAHCRTPEFWAICRYPPGCVFFKEGWYLPGEGNVYIRRSALPIPLKLSCNIVPVN
jgi:hypothetical protein